MCLLFGHYRSVAMAVAIAHAPHPCADLAPLDYSVPSLSYGLAGR